MDKFFFERLLPIWRKWYAGALAGVAAALVVFYSITDGLDEVESMDWLVACVVLCAFLLLWRITNPKKKNPRGEVGICVAIRAESDTEHAGLQYKLVDALKQKLRQSIAGGKINLVALPNHECEELDDVQAALAKMAGTRSHLIMHGRAVTGSIDGKPVTSLRLEAVVIHANTNTKNRELLAQEMRFGIPQETIIELQNDLKGFELLSTQLDQVAKYVIAIAAFLSRDLQLASKLLGLLKGTLDSTAGQSDSLAYLKAVVPKRIRMVKRAQLDAAYSMYVSSRNIEELAKQEQLADDLLAQDQSDYKALLYKSIIAFASRGNCDEAEALLQRCGKTRDATWMYNYAFLLTYKGQLWEAHDMYKRAFNAKSHMGNVPVESEEFIRLVLTKEPQRRHLIFAIGLINYNAKKDFGLAAEAFQEFTAIDNAEAAWPEAFTLVQYLLQRCKARA